jgi:rhodanese-related sulfurtransferase
MNTQKNVRMLANDPNAPYRAIAELGRVLASPQRARLIHLLCQCDRTVEELAEAMDESVANVSHHLQLLKKVQLVTAHRLDRRIAYGLADDGVRLFWQSYRDFAAARLTEMRVIATELAERRHKAGGTVSRSELATLLKKEAVVLIDVRPRAEYDASHIAGAISVPLDELTQQIKALPRNKTVVIYCRGPYCLLGDAAQEKLAAKSVAALRLAEGVLDWKSAGLPVKHSAGYKPLIKRNEP